MSEQLASLGRQPRSADIERVLTEAVVDPETYGRLIGLGRAATYRALNAGSPIEPIRIGKKTFRVPTTPLRRLLQLEAESNAAWPARSAGAPPLAGSICAVPAGAQQREI